MNAGVIASRYAKALLKYVAGTGSGDKVYAQACVLGLSVLEVRQLRYFIENNADLSMERKIELLRSAAGEDLAAELVDFVRLDTIDYIKDHMFGYFPQSREAHSIHEDFRTALPIEHRTERQHRP